MINLKLAGQKEENIDIEKYNKIKIINYNKYIEFYKYFYERSNLFIENKEITKKDCVFIDITSIGAILKELEFKKNSLLYDYILIKYNEIKIENKDIFYNSFLDQIELLKDNVDLDVEIMPEEELTKVIIQNIDIKINFQKLLSEFEKILQVVINYNIIKTYIIFYNSSFMELNRNYDNCFNFDCNPFLNVSDYNILVANEIISFNYKTLIKYLKDIWPIEYYNQEIEYLVNDYFCYNIHKKIFRTKREKIYLLSNILNKEYKLNQKIICDKVVFDSIIKSFIDNM